MKKIIRKRIDWIKTGQNLEFNRTNNISLKRYVCFILNFDKENCSGDCDICTHELDNQISRKELGKIFNVTENVIQNWENGETPVPYEDLLLYQEICGMKIEQIVIFEDSKHPRK